MLQVIVKFLVVIVAAMLLGGCFKTTQTKSVTTTYPTADGGSVSKTETTETEFDLGIRGSFYTSARPYYYRGSYYREPPRSRKVVIYKKDVFYVDDRGRRHRHRY